MTGVWTEAKINQETEAETKRNGQKVTGGRAQHRDFSRLRCFSPSLRNKYKAHKINKPLWHIFQARSLKQM